MALDTFNPYLFVSSGEQSNKFLTPTYADGIAKFQAQRAQSLTGLTVRIDPIQEGTGDPSPDNIRPISGRTGMTVKMAGRNILPLPYSAGSSQTTSGITFSVDTDGKVAVSGTSTGNTGFNLASNLINAVGLREGQTVYISSGTAYNEDAYCRLLYADNSSGIGRISREKYALTITADMVRRGVVFQIWVTSGHTIAATFAPTVSFAPMDSYEKYAGQTYPISWQTEAGTIYGGTLDVVSGVLTVDKGYASFDGKENWNWQDGGTYKRTACPLSDVYNPGGRVSVQSNAGTFRASGNDVGTIFANGTTLFYYPDASITSLDAYKTWLASNNLQVVYPLATPRTYQLTPTEVRTIAGFNQIYSDAGPVIDIKF